MIASPDDLAPRGELFCASAMAENGILKIGKKTAFQAHMIEHQLSAYTNCNHGFGLAVIHPTMYRHMMGGAPEQFARRAARRYSTPTRSTRSWRRAGRSSPHAAPRLTSR